MYAKLFSRITSSSLMEEPLNVRYTFMMMLAVADPEGLVIGTDVALARVVNMPLDEFKECVAALMRADPESNSKELEGRRIVASDGERGYRIVNFLKYRAIRNEEERREYMTNYMSAYRKNGKDKSRPVNSVNNGKQRLARLAQAEAEAEAEAEKTPIVPKGDGGVESLRLRVGSWFKRKPSTAWSKKERAALAAVAKLDTPVEDLDLLEAYYFSPAPYKRTDVSTLLNNWQGEIDRARKAITQTAEPDPDAWTKEQLKWKQ